jgi:hypothetical protein
MSVSVLRNYASYMQFFSLKEAPSQSKLQKLTQENYVLRNDFSPVNDLQLTSVISGKIKIKMKLRSKIMHLAERICWKFLLYKDQVKIHL